MMQMMQVTKTQTWSEFLKIIATVHDAGEATNQT